MASEGERGQTAFENKDYEKAITHLTAALKSSQSPLWLIQRSTAYQRTNQADLALADAEAAVRAAVSRQRRELIGTAQFRRALALHALGRFGDARLCLTWTHKYNPKEKSLTMWIAKVKTDYEKAGGSDAEINSTTVIEIPQESETKPAKSQKDIPAPPVAVSQPSSKASTQTPIDKIRMEWYQSGSNVTVEFIAKGIPKEDVQVTIDTDRVEVKIPVAVSSNVYTWTADPVFASILPKESSFRVTPHKLELILVKSFANVKWSSLQGQARPNDSIPADTSTPPPASVQIPVQQKDNKPPAYPTSSRTGPKNWDKELSKEEDDDEAGGDETNAFFKKLFKDADPDTKRAMMKSFQESNGTALSTDWNDVKSKTFETSPPDGLEAKKWES